VTSNSSLNENPWFYLTFGIGWTVLGIIALLLGGREWYQYAYLIFGAAWLALGYWVWRKKRESPTRGP